MSELVTWILDSLEGTITWMLCYGSAILLLLTKDVRFERSYWQLARESGLTARHLPHQGKEGCTYILRYRGKSLLESWVTTFLPD